MLNVLLALAAMFWVGGCHGGQAASSSSKGGRLTCLIDLRPHVGPEEFPWLVFSEDSSLVCLWWWPESRSGDYKKEPVEFRVFDLQGRLVSSSADSNHLDVLRSFPSVAWREVWKERMKRGGLWSFTRDLKRAYRAGISNGAPAVERWDSPTDVEPRWTARIPGRGAAGNTPMARLLEPNGASVPILISLREAAVVDIETGELKPSISFEPADLKAKAAAKDDGDDLDPSLDAYPSTFAFESAKGMLACAPLQGSWVRVVGTTAPQTVLFETRCDRGPGDRQAMGWSVMRLQFDGSGTYLVVDYHFSGREPKWSKTRTDVYDTRDWHTAWMETDLNVRAATISPDGTRIAFLRKQSLEIRTFAGESPAAK